MGLEVTYFIIYCLSKMVAKSKHFKAEDVDLGNAYHFQGRYVTSSYFLLYNSFARVLTLVLILQGFGKGTHYSGLTCGLHGTLIST